MKCLTCKVAEKLSHSHYYLLFAIPSIMFINAAVHAFVCVARPSVSIVREMLIAWAIANTVLLWIPLYLFVLSMAMVAACLDGKMFLEKVRWMFAASIERLRIERQFSVSKRIVVLYYLIYVVGVFGTVVESVAGG
jgi:hypothetical protein